MKRLLATMLAILLILSISAPAESAMQLTWEITDTRLMDRWNGETSDEYSWFCINGKLTNWHVDAQTIAEHLTGRLVFRGAYTFEAVTDFDSDTIAPLVEKQGSLVFPIPKLVAANMSAEDVQIYVNIDGTEYPIALDAIQTPAKTIETFEGPGYDTPEEAVLAYLEGLNHGDAVEMLSTFAIESYVDHVDVESYIGRLHVYMLSNYISTPCYNEYARSVKIVRRYGEVANSLQFQHAEISAQTYGIPVTIQNSEELQQFTTLFADSAMNSWAGNVEFIEWLEPAKLSERFMNSINLAIVALRTSIIGAEDYVLLAAHIHLNGIDALQTMGCAQYNGRWYNCDLSNNISDLLALNPYYAGLLYNAPEYLQGMELSDLRDILSGTVDPETTAIMAGWDASYLLGSHWQLKSLNGANYAVLDTADTIRENASRSIWASLRFMHLGSAVIDLRFSPDLDAEIANGFDHSKICFIWDDINGLLETGRYSQLLSSLDLENTSAYRNGDTIVFTLPSGLQATFERVD